MSIQNSSIPHAPFGQARRIQESFLAAREKKILLWLAQRTPVWINSDHLTAIGLLAMAAAGAAYWWSANHRLGLLAVIPCLAVNWLGDSLDGTLARFRNLCRPRYGFYVDHIVDAFSATFLLGGLALSGYMTATIALGVLTAFLLVSIESYLAAYTLGDFKISYFRMGPTELRVLMCLGNLALFFSRSPVHLMGRSLRPCDIAGTIGVGGMALTAVISAIEHSRRLFRQEPLPVLHSHSAGDGGHGRNRPSQGGGGRNVK